MIGISVAYIPVRFLQAELMSYRTHEFSSDPLKFCLCNLDRRWLILAKKKHHHACRTEVVPTTITHLLAVRGLSQGVWALASVE